MGAIARRWGAGAVAACAEGDALPEPLFRVVSDETVQGHRYIHVKPIDSESFIRAVAPLITERYFDEVTARARLLRSASELALFSGTSFELSEEEIADALAEERDAVLPQSWQEGGRSQHLDVQRSEFGEIVASEVLKQVFGTLIPASRIAHKEIPDQQTRGADVMGLEGVELARPTLVVGEVKGSQDRKSPPSVVGEMVSKLEALSKNRRAMLQELVWLRDYSDEEHAQICARIHTSFLLRKDYFEMVLSPLLVRSDSTHQANDAGVFKSDPTRFKKPIRWVSIVVEGDLFELAQEVYRIAREGAA